MAEQGRAVVLPVALLDAEPVGQKSVAAGSVGHEPGLPSLLQAVFLPRGHYGTVRMEIDAGDAASFDRSCPLAGRVAEQDLIELRAAHLIGKRKRPVPCVRKIDVDRLVVPLRDELGAVLGQPIAFNSGDASRSNRCMLRGSSDSPM